MKSYEIVVVINPGSTSTKIALFNRSELINEHIIRHSQSKLDQFQKVSNQYNYRYQIVESVLDDMLSKIEVVIVGIVGRGGIVKPLKGGTYRINNNFLEDAKAGKYGDHASNLGSLLANKLAKHFNLQESFTVDPVSAGNLCEKARISGVPGIERNRRGHPLNMKMTARKSVETLLSKNSGLKAYLGVDDLRDVFTLIDTGNKKAQLIYDAFVYQIAKEIGAYHVALKCKANGIIITGGIAYSDRFIFDLKTYVEKLTNFFVYPGENEMEALAEGAFRVIDKKETALEY